MSVLETLYEDVVGFYRGWHALETSGIYSDGHEIVDQDYSPLLHHDDFSSRREVLGALTELRRRLAEQPGLDQMVWDNLVASATFLRAMLGERLSLRHYVSVLYLYDPVPIPERTLEATAADVQELCGHFGLEYRPEDRLPYFARFRVESPDEVVELARAGQDYWLDRLYRHIEPLDELKIEIETVQKDEPWSFFLSSHAGLATWSINTHPRHTFTRGQCKYIASHEIAGHAVQNPSWARAVTRAGLPAALHIHATHHPIVTLAEGIAQALPYFLCPRSELDPEMMLAKKLRELRDMVLANAQLMLEGGSPVTAVWEYCTSRLFFVEPFEIERDLANRVLKPAQRAYQHCYAPAFLAFHRLAESLDQDEVGEFLRSHYQQIPSVRDFWRRAQEVTA
ncbi:hypothetical protein ACTMTI_40115 [Nonomuraea sp. H19]|uniref:hypothetical protein n=1 Tax=Nonomuraea sp. H19 TaxID=3452206 RepID=UPI003F8AAD63